MVNVDDGVVLDYRPYLRRYGLAETDFIAIMDSYINSDNLLGARPSCIIIDVVSLVLDCKLEALVDTGSSYSICSEVVAQALVTKGLAVKKGKPIAPFAMGGARIDASETIEITFRIWPYRDVFKYQCYVVSHMPPGQDIILGEDFCLLYDVHILAGRCILGWEKDRSSPPRWLIYNSSQAVEWISRRGGLPAARKDYTDVTHGNLISHSPHMSLVGQKEPQKIDITRRSEQNISDAKMMTSKTPRNNTNNREFVDENGSRGATRVKSIEYTDRLTHSSQKKTLYPSRKQRENEKRSLVPELAMTAENIGEEENMQRQVPLPLPHISTGAKPSSHPKSGPRKPRNQTNIPDVSIDREREWLSQNRGSPSAPTPSSTGTGNVMKPSVTTRTPPAPMKPGGDKIRIPKQDIGQEMNRGSPTLDSPGTPPSTSVYDGRREISSKVDSNRSDPNLDTKSQHPLSQKQDTETNDLVSDLTSQERLFVLEALVRDRRPPVNNMTRPSKDLPERITQLRKNLEIDPKEAAKLGLIAVYSGPGLRESRLDPNTVVLQTAYLSEALVPGKQYLFEPGHGAEKVPGVHYPAITFDRTGKDRNVDEKGNDNPAPSTLPKPTRVVQLVALCKFAGPAIHMVPGTLLGYITQLPDGDSCRVREYSVEDQLLDQRKGKVDHKSGKPAPPRSRKKDPSQKGNPPSRVAPLVDFIDYAESRRKLNRGDSVALQKHFERVWDTLQQNLDEELTDHQRESVKKLVQKYCSVWDTFPQEHPPKANYEPVRLGIPAEQREMPIYIRRPQRSVVERQYLKDITKEMETFGLIKKSKSSWCFPVVLVKKPNGTLRFTVDYSSLTPRTHKDRFPLPRTDEMFDSLAGSSWFSSADASSGFYQLPIHEDDIPITAFSDGEQLWEWLRLPMGLTNSPAIYQRAMNSILGSGLLGVCAYTYIDDIVVFSKSFEQHLLDLEKLLVRLSDANVTLRATKTYLCKRKFNYLGYIVTPEGIAVDKDKLTKVISIWPTPKTLKECRSFVGFINHYRKFIHNCSVVAAPLTDAMKAPPPGSDPKKINFVRERWNPRCEEAFRKLKDSLLNSQLLKHPDFDKRFTIDVDSSSIGTGAVLTQKYDGVEHPVAFFSKKFGPAEAGWHSTDQEALGIVLALDHFRPYIYGQDFDLKTDNKSVNLTWLMKKPHSGKLGRWAARLREYDGYMNILHKKGANMPHVDAISRTDFGETPQNYDDYTGTGTPLSRDLTSHFPSRMCVLDDKHSISDTQIQHMLESAYKTPGGTTDSFDPVTWRKELTIAQRKDTTLADIILQLTGRLEGPEETSYNFRIKDNLLWRRVEWPPNTKVERWALAIPNAWIGKVLSLVHDRQNMSHVGKNKTIALIRPRFWWRGMTRDIVEYVRTCPACQIHKAKVKPTPQWRQQTKLVEYPNELLCIDFAGPFTLDKCQFKYVLTMIDVFSGLAVEIPMRNMEQAPMLEALEKQWFRVYGRPTRILTDRGAQFSKVFSSVFDEWCMRRGITHSETTREHPQTNAEAERVHRWLRERIGIAINIFGGKWYQHLPVVVEINNMTPGAGKSRSAFEIFFGRRPRFDFDTLTDLGQDYDQLVAELKVKTGQELEEMRQTHLAEKEVIVARNLRGNVSLPVCDLKVGEWVLVNRPKVGKLDRPVAGPYPIVAQRTPYTFVIRRRKWGNWVDDTVHANRLTRYHVRSPVLSPEALALGTPPGLRVSESSIVGAGFGVIADRAFLKGTCLGEYVGERLSPHEYEHRYPNQDAAYVLEVSDVDETPVFIDAQDVRHSNWTRFMNANGPDEHPNVYVVDEEGRAYIMAGRNIVAGEELLWDYGLAYRWGQPQGNSANRKVRSNLHHSIDPNPPISYDVTGSEPVHVDQDIQAPLSVAPTTDVKEMVAPSDVPVPIARDDPIREHFHVGDLCAFMDEEEMFGWTLGRIIAYDADDSTYDVHCYGHTDMRKSKTKDKISTMPFYPGYRDTRDNRVVYTLRHRDPSRYAMYLARFLAADLLLGRVEVDRRCRVPMSALETIKARCEAWRRSELGTQALSRN